jgi:hypothetical protein
MERQTISCYAVDLDSALKDSPEYRASLQRIDQDLEALQKWLLAISKELKLLYDYETS